MPITATPERREQLTIALQQVRTHRHHTQCACNNFRGYCTPEHRLWSTALDRILDNIRLEELSTT